MSDGVGQARISIIITNYNYGRFLPEAILSAQAQTHPVDEIIVVDDGSRDDSVDVARQYPVRLLTQANQGVCVARNFGASQSTGEYLMFLDADDVLEPDYVRLCLEALRQSPAHVAYAYTQMRYFGHETGLFESRPFDRTALLKGNFVHAASLMRKSVLDEVGGYDPRWKRGYEDYELWVRMLSRGYEGVFVPLPLLRYRRHASSRNTLDAAVLDRLTWQIRGSYPWLHIRWLFRRPLRYLFWSLSMFFQRRKKYFQ